MAHLPNLTLTESKEHLRKCQEKLNARLPNRNTLSPKLASYTQQSLEYEDIYTKCQLPPMSTKLQETSRAIKLDCQGFKNSIAQLSQVPSEQKAKIDNQMSNFVAKANSQTMDFSLPTTNSTTVAKSYQNHPFIFPDQLENLGILAANSVDTAWLANPMREDKKKEQMNQERPSEFTVPEFLKNLNSQKTIEAMERQRILETAANARILASVGEVLAPVGKVLSTINEVVDKPKHLIMDVPAEAVVGGGIKLIKTACKVPLLKENVCDPVKNTYVEWGKSLHKGAARYKENQQKRLAYEVKQNEKIGIPRAITQQLHNDALPATKMGLKIILTFLGASALKPTQALVPKSLLAPSSQALTVTEPVIRNMIRTAKPRAKTPSVTIKGPDGANSFVAQVAKKVDYSKYYEFLKTLKDSETRLLPAPASTKIILDQSGNQGLLVNSISENMFSVAHFEVSKKSFKIPKQSFEVLSKPLLSDLTSINITDAYLVTKAELRGLTHREVTPLEIDLLNKIKE